MAPDQRDPLSTGAGKAAEELDHLRRQLQEALDRQAATNEILHLISDSPVDSQPVFDAIVQSGSRLFPEAAISVALPLGDKVEAVAVMDNDPARAEAWRRRFPFPLTLDYMHGVVILEGRVVDIPDVASSPDQDSAGAKNFLASGYRAVTMMPLLREGKAIGVLSIVRLAPGPLSDEQLTVLQSFAAQAVIAIENTRMLSELRQTNGILNKVSRHLAKYISPQLYQSIVRGEQDVAIVAKRKKLTVFFSDIADFTETADRLESEELTQLLNHYLTEMSRIALDHGATIDKYVGDAIVIFFGDPETRGVKEDALACVDMAIAMRERMADLEEFWRDSGIEKPLKCRIGINTGFCTVGNFGSEDRMDYTIIGGGVNFAARLEETATPGEILISYETYALIKDEIACERVGEFSVKGIAYPVETYRVLDRYGAAEKRACMIRESRPYLQLKVDLKAMSAEERREAATLLRQALDRL